MKNVAQIIMRTLKGGCPNEVNRERKTGGNKGIQTLLPEGNEKRKVGYTGRINPAHRVPPEIRRPPLRRQAGSEVMVYAEGEAVKLKPEKRPPANRKGKRLYPDEVISTLRLVWLSSAHIIISVCLTIPDRLHKTMRYNRIRSAP
jgi:hypothetical protein